MKHKVHLQYDLKLKSNVRAYLGELCKTDFADIIYTTDEETDTANSLDRKGIHIGFAQLVLYNQALAIEYGVNMSNVPFLAMQLKRKVLMQFDYKNITRETIDEIGAAGHPNILILARFGISAAWRNKGIGEQVLKGLVKQMKDKCGYIIILDAKPPQCENDTVYEDRDVELAGLEEDPEKAQWKLNAFLQRCGFRLFKDFDDVFVCNVEKALAAHIND